MQGRTKKRREPCQSLDTDNKLLPHNKRKRNLSYRCSVWTPQVGAGGGSRWFCAGGAFRTPPALHGTVGARSADTATLIPGNIRQHRVVLEVQPTRQTQHPPPPLLSSSPRESSTIKFRSRRWFRLLPTAAKITTVVPKAILTIVRKFYVVFPWFFSVLSCSTLFSAYV